MEPPNKQPITRVEDASPPSPVIGTSSSAGRHIRTSSSRSAEGSRSNSVSRPKSPRIPTDRPIAAASPPPQAPISLSGLVTALISTKRHLGLGNLSEAVSVLSSALKSAQAPQGVTKVGDSADSDFFVGDYPRVRGILGESWVHRSVKDGRWETVRRWIRRSRESAISSPRLSEPELSPEFEELESHTEGGEEFVGLGIGTATSDTEASDSKGNLSRKTSIGSRVVGGGIGTPKPASSKVNEWLEKSGGINARFRTIVGTTPLHEACSMIPYFSNDSDKPSPTTANAAHTVSDLLAQGADPLLRDLFGLTPLHRACIAGNMEVIKALLECTSPVVAQQQLAVTDNHGNTPLHVAAYHNHADAVLVLLASGADMDARDEDGGTALHDAAEGGAENSVRVLIESGKSAVELGPDGINRNKMDTNARNFTNRTALHEATTPEVAALLLDNGGAKLNAVDVDGFTPLHRAAARGLVNLVSYFLALPGIKVDQRTKPHRRTSLHLACAHGSGFFKNVDCTVPLNYSSPSSPSSFESKIVVDFPAVIALLLKSGANPASHTHPHRNTPVHVCCSFRPSPPLDRDLEREQKEWLDVLRMLLRSGQQEGVDPEHGDPAKPNRYLAFRNCFGDTPLHCAIVPEVAEVLLSYGADPDVQNWNGETAVDSAKRTGRTKVEQFLVEHGAHMAANRPAPVPVPPRAAEPKPEEPEPKQLEISPAVPATRPSPPAVAIRPGVPLPPRPGNFDLLRKSSLSTNTKAASNSGMSEIGEQTTPVAKKVNFADGSKEEEKEKTPDYDPAVRNGD